MSTNIKRISGEIPAKLYDEFRQLCRTRKKKANIMLQIGLREWLDDERRSRG